MESELLTDVTFFNGLVNVSNFQRAERSKTPQKSPRKTTPNSCKSETKKAQKENSAQDKLDGKKPGRPSKKAEREPLKVINAKVKTPKKNVSSTTKKNGVSPATKKNEGISTGKRKSTSKVISSPHGMSKTQKEKQTAIKIVVFKDTPTRAKGQDKGNKRNPVVKLSKSWDGSDTKNRRSHVERKKSPKISDPGAKKVRYSLNDLSNIKSPNKKPKSPAESRRSLPRTSTRLSKIKSECVEFDEMLSKLETLFPNVDPEFIKSQFVKFKGSLHETIEFLIIKEKTNELPTRNDYMRRLETEKLNNKFIENFSIENFLKMIPDPWEHFLKTERKNCPSYLGHSLHYLKNKYKKHYLRVIQEALKKNGCSLYLANKELKKKNRFLKMRATNRSKSECDAGKPTTFDIQFIHEVVFIENESKIKAHIKKAETAKYKKFKEAEKAGTLLECQSCNDFSLLQDDAVNCPANHVFCKDCVVNYVEIEMGKDNFQFKCLIKCEEKFSLESLQAILSPSLMAKIIKRNQLEEIKSAGIDDLVCCPFCYYVIIMPPEMTVLKCLNPSCLMESCRYCKQLSHIPLKCHELEKFDKSVLDIELEIVKEEQKIKTEVKDSPITCAHCNGEFFKRDDSDLMVCPCGATVCSICRQPFPGCLHSNQSWKEPSHNISFSSDDSDVTQYCKTPAGDDFERSSNCSENFLAFPTSESDSF